MFAIVDIETTGGHAAESGIIEICIILHNGEEIEGHFQSLINPQQKIPAFISALTGITQHMVVDAPTFDQLADKIYNLLQGRIFVAHNVNFDYSFVRHFLLQHGFDLQCKKLCTVRYARKVRPGLVSYSLGKLCRQLNIEIQDRHRAYGDATATVALLKLLLESDLEKKHFAEMVKGRNPDQYLPLHVPREQLDNLPYCPGVYYFRNKHKKIIYVGKAVNLKYRVRSHFSNNSIEKRKQEMIREVYFIEYKVCASELMALILEAIEIKRLWPYFNRSQKRFEQTFGLYTMEDQNGLIRLVIEKKRKHLPALYSFYRTEEGYDIVRKAAIEAGIEEQRVFALAPSPKLNSIEKEDHNFKMKQALNSIDKSLPTFAIIQQGEDEKGRPLKIAYLIEKGKFYGMGYIKEDININSKEELLPHLTHFHDHEFIRSILMNYQEKFPENAVSVN